MYRKGKLFECEFEFPHKHDIVSEGKLELLNFKKYSKYNKDPFQITIEAR